MSGRQFLTAEEASRLVLAGIYGDIEGEIDTTDDLEYEGTLSSDDGESSDSDAGPSTSRPARGRPRGSRLSARDFRPPATAATDGPEYEGTLSSDDGESSDSDVGPSTSRPARGRGRTRGRPRGSRLSARDSRPPATAANKYSQWNDVTNNDAGGPETPYRFRPHISGVNEMPPDGTGPGDYFKLFFTEELVTQIVDETNRYAQEKISRMVEESGLSEFSRLRSWKDVTVKEMYLVIGMILNMGIVKLPDIAAYWTEKWTRRLEFFPKCMIRNRFQLIFHTMLHSCDVDEAGRLKGDKIQPIIDYLIKKFQRHFGPYQELSADETMIGFKGRVSFKQYIPKKPTKWGLFARTLADSNTGYMLNIKTTSFRGIIFGGGGRLGASNTVIAKRFQVMR